MRGPAAESAFKALAPRRDNGRRRSAPVLVKILCERGHLLAEVYRTRAGPLLVSMADAPYTPGFRQHARDLGGWEDLDKNLQNPAPDLVLEPEPADYKDPIHYRDGAAPLTCRCGKRPCPRDLIVAEVQREDLPRVVIVAAGGIVSRRSTAQ